MVSVSKVVGLGFTAVSTAFVIFLLISGVTDNDEQRVNKIILEILYGGSFNATITENGQESVLTGYGLIRTSLERVGNEEWVISTIVEKGDSGNVVLHVSFKTVDGEVLASDSTSEPFGVASISLTL